MSRAPSSSSASSGSSGSADAKLGSWFATLCDEDPERIDMDGIVRLCEQVGLDAAEDVRVLVLLWRLGARSRPGCLAKTEFVAGMKAIGVSDAAGLRSRLPSLDPGFLETAEFRDFYRFAFQFSREGTHKTIEKDLILSLLPLVLDAGRAPHLGLFLEFFRASPHASMNLDQWDSFLAFQTAVRHDLSNYDDDGAWPVLIDEYVEWRRKTKK